MSPLAIGVPAAFLALTSTANANDLASFYATPCPEQTVFRWCASKASADGWKLRYESTSSREMMDVNWHHEIWTRDKAIVLCMHEGGRGGIRINHCVSLREVQQ